MRTPARITGGYRSGKTSALRALSDRFERPLVICSHVAAAATFGRPATTFWGLASEIVARYDRPVRVLSTEEVRARVGDDELGDTICHFQASFLGREELRTHAAAAGQAERWEDMADAADRYLSALDGEADWAGVLVRASLLLRDEDRLHEERSRFDAVLVDDYEAASFAANRLLSQFAGFGGPVVVAGNPDNLVWRHVGGSPVYLDRFPRRFGAVEEVRLDERHAEFGSGDVVLSLEPGGDPWRPPPTDRPVPVALATSLSWERADIVDRMGDGEGGRQARYDLDLLAGPDVPDDEVKAARQAAERAARLALARTRAGQTTVQPPST